MPSDAKLRVFSPPQLPKPVGYSHVGEITSGKLIYIAGQVAMDSAGKLVGEGDYRAQLRQVFANLNTALQAAGASFKNVIKLNYYIVDRVERADFFVARCYEAEAESLEGAAHAAPSAPQEGSPVGAAAAPVNAASEPSLPARNTQTEGK